MIRRFGLRAALTLLVLIAIAPVFVVVLQASLEERGGRVERAETAMRSVAGLAAVQQERFIDGARHVLSAVAFSPAVYQDDDRACAAYMARMQAEFPAGFGTFGLLDRDGTLICRSAPTKNSVNSSDRLFFRTAMRTGRFSVGEYTVSRANGRPVLTFGLPVFRDETRTQLRGVAYLAMDLTQAAEELRRIALAPEMTLMVSDASGVVIAAAGSRAVPVGAKLPEEFLLRAVSASQAQVARTRTDDGEEWLYAVQPAGRPGEGKLHVAALMSADDILAPSSRRLQQQLAALVIIALLGATAAWMFGDRVVVRPLGRMLRSMDLLRDESVVPPARLDGAPRAAALVELRDLEQRFQDMSRSLAERAVQRDGALAEMAGQNNLMEAILAGMGEGVLVIDKGRFVHINAAALRILPGLAELNRHAHPLRHADAASGLYELDGRTPLTREGRSGLSALAGGHLDDFRVTVRGKLSHGEEKIVQGHSRELQAPDGTHHGTLVVFADVTEAHRAEEQLKDRERRYRTLFESNPHPMWVFDMQTLAFLTVNDAAVAHYGWSREEFMAMTIKDIRPEEDVVPLVAAAAGRGVSARPEVWRHRLKDGRLIHVEISSHALDYAGRNARMVLAHDITQRLKAEQALLDLNESLERRVDERTRELEISNRELESFSYSVSHDLRAPLQVIDGFGRSLMARHAEHLNEQARHYLQRIRENTKQMGELIDDLLSLARVTRSELKTEPLDLAPRADQVVQRLRQRFPEREVEVQIDASIPCEADARLIGVVLENLLENAWKFTARTPQARIHVGGREEGGQRVVYVADNGAGFDMAYADKLFNPFHRLHAATDFEGTGIGLATVHRVIARHGGRVWAQARPGEGATFLFTLKNSTTTTGAPDEAHTPDSAGGGQPRPPGAHADDAGREPCAQ